MHLNCQSELHRKKAVDLIQNYSTKLSLSPFQSDMRGNRGGERLAVVSTCTCTGVVSLHYIFLVSILQKEAKLWLAVQIKL